MPSGNVTCTHTPLLEILEFEQGSYTILHDEKTDEGIQVLFTISDSWDYSSGGSIIVVDGTGEFKNVSSPENTFTIINIKKQCHIFHKYVNHNAGNKKMYVVRKKFYMKSQP